MYTMKTIKNLLLAGFIGISGILAGCGGGGASGSGATDGDPTDNDAPSAASAITDLNLVRAADGQSVTSVTPSQPVRVVITTTATDVINLNTTIGTLSKTAVVPVDGKAEVLLTVSITDTSDGTLTVTTANGASKTLAFIVGQTNLALGAGTPFVSGALAIGLPTISAGGTSQVSAVLVDSATNLPFTQPIDVVFTSTCGASGKAQISTPVTTVSGSAVSTYRDINCGQVDVITATASVGGQVYSATGSLTVESPTVGSIQYVSATPTNIGLKGSGGVEVSQVWFRVFDSNGNVLGGNTVDFELNTNVGGITLTQASVQTDGAGLARADVNAGTVSTAVRVTATIRGTSLATQSSQLYVSTGLPEHRRFSLAVEKRNMECFNYDGEESKVTAFLADRFGNPPPDGTAVQFRTKYGSISPAACNTVNGVCVATWRSHGQRGNGRSALLATAVGEESFDDVNPSNGLFDATETFDLVNNDLPEAWLDSNEDGVRDPDEEYLDFNDDGNYDIADGKYNGAACDPTLNSQCSSMQRSLHIRSRNLIVCSTSGALINVFADNNNNGAVDSDDGNGNCVQDPGEGDGGDGVFDIERCAVVAATTPPGGTRTARSVNVVFTVTDLNGNPMAAGTSIACSTTNGSLVGTASFVMPDSTTPIVSPFARICTVEGDTTASNGLFTIKVTSPKGLITERTLIVRD